MLITYLSTRKFVLPFNDIPELLDQTDFIIAIAAGTSYEDAFAKSNDPVKIRAWEERIKPNLDIMFPGKLPWIDHLMNLMMADPKIAVYSDSILYENTPEYGRCDILSIPARFDKSTTGYAFQRDSQYVQLFNHYLNIIYEEGISEKIFKTYESGGQVCPDYNGLPLGFDSCISSFIVFGVGLSIALVMFIVECLLPIFMRSKTKRAQDMDVDKWGASKLSF